MNELHFALTVHMQEEALNVLFPRRPPGEQRAERGFLGIIHQGEGNLRRTLFLREIVPQEEDWVTWTPAGLQFSPYYFSRAFDTIAERPKGAGIIIVHSHFGPSDPSKRPKPSTPDLIHERQLLRHASHVLPGASPLAAGILSLVGTWRVREYKFQRTQGDNTNGNRAKSSTHRDVTGVRFIDQQRLRFQLATEEVQGLDVSEIDSTLALWGKKGQRLLSAIRTGVVGVGGVGSILVEFLARLGVGELVLVDYDVLEKENLNRSIGAKRSDVGKPKIRYVTRLARESATARKFLVRSFRGSVAEEEGLKAVLDCDTILSVTGDAFARQVLDHASYAYMIPIIDGGTALILNPDDGEITGKSQVAQAGPGGPCLECLSVYTRDEATIAREEPGMRDQSSYVRMAGNGAPANIPRAPSVVATNGLVASIMIQRFLSTVLGFPPRAVGQQRYYINQGEMLWGPTEKCHYDCPKASWTGLGDSHPIPVGVDLAWKQLKNFESGAKGQHGVQG